MAQPHDDDDQKPISVNNKSYSSSLTQEEEEEENEVLINEDYYEENLATSGCFCFHRLFCFGERRRSRQYRSGDARNLLQQSSQQQVEENWWIKRGKKLREISELLAGPKWKTYIRKLSTNFNNNCRRNKMNQNHYGYDPQSYALNFAHKDDEDDVGTHLTGFSARFSSPLVLGGGGNYTTGITSTTTTTTTIITS